MDDTVPLHPTALRDWETQLVPQVRQVELLGEIPIAADECAQLGKIIGLQVRTLGHNQGLRTLRREHPCALAVYLVAQGVYGYQGGDYWSEVVQVTGLRSGYTWQVGQAFEEILEDLDLPLFYDMRAEAHRYVSLILAHGGIPDYCLPDFFANMLQPSVIRAQYAGMPATELIDEWQWRSSIQYFTDKPVLRFLAYGGRVAEDFVDRCREMARETLDSGLVPDAEAVGLPGRVVDAYRRWIAEQDADQIQREATDRWRLRKPEVLVDPWGEGVILDLPPQQVPATMIHADVVWQITAGGESHEVPVHVRKTGFDWKTAAESFPLSQPAPAYEISLLTNGQVKRTWRYEGPSDERPILVFDAERGTLLPWKHSLPARCLGLLYPAQLDLRVEGKANLLEELPRLPWGWADFRGQTWDLGGANCLTLLRGDDAVLIAPLRPDESAQRPHLVGGELLSPEKPGLCAPVYVGSPPCIRIPLVGRRDTGEELARRRLTVRNKWPAVPEAQVTQTLADLRPELAFSNRYVDLPLGVSRLLGEAPFGNYLVRLRGPLGRDAEFTLRVVPHLVLCGHEALYLPDAQAGPQAVTLLAETAPGDSLECQEESGDCRVRETERRSDGWEYEIVVGPEITEVELTVVRPLPSGDAARVPVLVSIHRLRWALAGEQAAPTRREWTGRTIKRPVDELLQTRSPYLLVALPLVEANQVRLALRLLDIDGTELQIANQASVSRGQRLWRFDLTAFLDTVRASSFRVCYACGFAEPAPEEPTGRRRRTPHAHRNPRTGRSCRGRLYTHHLGHEFITDVLELRFDDLLASTLDYELWLSLLYALLEGASEALGIRRDDLDGTLYRYSAGIAPALVLFDNVPGGAGHVRRIADELRDVFLAAWQRVDRCECGEETSCYECLRNYRNQPYHDQLKRGLARDFLHNLLQAGETGFFGKNPVSENRKA